MSRTDFLYELLPIIYRQRDLTAGAAPHQPLRALFAILQEQYDLLEADIATLYDNWFVETCEPWALPYIADLMDVGPLSRAAHPGIDTRSLVANTLAYRRRKGTAATLERVIEDATGWPTRVVAFSDLLAKSGTVQRPRGGTGETIAIRDPWALARIGGAFDGAVRTADIRAKGRYNLNRVGLFVWRLRSYPLRQVTAGSPTANSACRTFHPLGREMPLFNRRLGRAAIEQRTTLRNVPAPLSRRMLRAERAGGVRRPANERFLSEPPAFAVYLGEARERVPAENMVVADLQSWTWPHDAQAQVAIDPERGRLMLHEAHRGDRVVTDHCYGLSGDIGGGPYFRPAARADADRSPWLARVRQPSPEAIVRSAGLDQTIPDWPIRDADSLIESQPATAEADGAHNYASLTQALAAWAAQEAEGIIEIADSDTDYPPVGEEGWTVALRAGGGRSLTIRAVPHRRPCLAGSLTVVSDGARCSLSLEGLLIEGPLHVSGALSLALRHCTLVPRHEQVAIAAHPRNCDGLQVTLASSIVGPVRLPAAATELKITDSVVDGGRHHAIAAPAKVPRDRASTLHRAGPSTVIARATLVGGVVVEQIEAVDAIFTAPLLVAHDGHGSVRHSYVPEGSRTPHRFSCQPQSRSTTPATHVRPIFTSLRVGHPGYAQLAPNCLQEIRAGGSDGGEMGAFHAIGGVWRERDMQEVLAEYLPFGFTPLTVYAT